MLLDIITEEIQALIDEREIARKNKNFIEADRIRNLLKEKGFDNNDKKI